MTAANEMDAVLREWLVETAPTSVPPGIHDDAIARVRRSRQHASWSARVRGSVARRSNGHGMRVAEFALVAAAVVSVALFGALTAGGPNPSGLPATSPPANASPSTNPSPSTNGSALPDPSPSADPSALQPPTRISWVGRPFEYRIPAGSGLQRLVTQSAHVVAWSGGTNHPATGASGEITGQAGASGNTGEIVIAWTTEPWTHGAASDAGRVPLRVAPREFLADLRDLGGIELTPATEAALDGHPALAVTTAPGTIFTGVDIHVAGSIKGLSSGTDFVLLGSPYRLIATQIDGAGVFVLIRARTDEDLAAWLPTAMTFVDSIHFVER